MTEFAFAHSRHFPRTDLAVDTGLVVPGRSPNNPTRCATTGRYHRCGGAGTRHCAAAGFNPETLFGSAQVIACGNMTNNVALRRLYTAAAVCRYLFPRGDGYFVKSISDPFGYGKNCIVLGAAAGRGLLAAFAGSRTWSAPVMGVTPGTRRSVPASSAPFPAEAQLEKMVQDDLKTWEGAWVSTPFRGGQVENYAWYYYLTDHPVWGRAVPAIFAGSLEPWLAQRRDYPETYHCFFHFHSLIHLWELIEDSPLYTEDDRRGVVTMIGEMLRHLAPLFYMEETVNPPDQDSPEPHHLYRHGLGRGPQLPEQSATALANSRPPRTWWSGFLPARTIATKPTTTVEWGTLGSCPRRRSRTLC